MDNNRKKAASYSRTSSRRQSYDSIDFQKSKAREYADSHDLDIVREYEDVAISGRTDKRSGFQELVSESRKYDAVLVLRYDRWARNTDIAVRYEQMLNENNAILISVTEDENDKLECYRKAEESSRHKSEAVLDKMNDLADEHKYLGGPMILGFSKDAQGSYTINQHEADLVRNIFLRYAEGETVDEIVADLDARQITTNRFMQWNRKTVQMMLKNEKYVGRYTWGEQSVNDAIPQIVSEDVFDQVQKKLQENASRGAHSKASGVNEYLLSGKLRCGCCESAMIGNSSNGISYYTCKNKSCHKTSLRKDSFEDMVFDLSCEFLTEDNNALIAKKYVEYRKTIAPEHEVQRLESIISRKKKYLETMPHNSSNREMFEHEIEKLEDTLYDEKNRTVTLTEDEVRFILHELFIGNIDAWYLRKFILDTLVSSVTYDGKLLTIDFNITDRFMNVYSESQQQYQIVWVDPDKVFEE